MAESNPSKTYREHRFFATQQERDIHDWRISQGVMPHVAPFSCLVACMGNHWEDGCQEAVYSMFEFASDQGYNSCYYEQPDLCYRPFEGIGTMRNEALRKAQREGFEYICYVDNDVKPPKDALVKLMHRLVPVIIPLPRFSDGQNHGIKAANPEIFAANRGIAMIGSTVISMVLFNVSVFSSFEAFWEDQIGAHEGYHFNKLYTRTGIRPFLDTDVQVQITQPPHFPLDHKPEA